MSKLEWKYVQPLNKKTDIDSLEIKYCYQLPKDLKECILKYNAGIPSLNKIDFGSDKDKVFGGLLSFNEGDEDSIYDFINIFISENGKTVSRFPFGIDPAGNFYCIENGSIVFYDHDFDTTIYICDGFTQFLKMLHD